MKKTIPLLTALSLFLSLQACKNNKKSSQKELTDENSVTIADEYGEHKVPKSPERVIAYNYQTVDIMDALDLEDNIIGFSKKNTPDYLKKFKENDDLKDVGGTKDPNFETINALNPGLIVMEHRTEKDHDELAKIAPTLMLDADYEDYVTSIKENVRKIGKIYGIEDKAQDKIKDLEKVVEANKAPEDSDKQGLVVMYNNGNFAAFGPNDSRYGFIYYDFNVKPVAKDIENSIHGQSISSEYIQEHNPDILYVIDKNAAHHEGDVQKSSIENKLVKETNAYKNDKIIYLTPDLWYYAGGIQSMKTMAKEIGAPFDKD